MTKVVFYEKPGCINNTRQKKMLRDAGHDLDSRDLLSESWDRETLLKFFHRLSVTMWFNSAAPAIKSGVIDPSGLTESEALQLLIDDPILIRRPLMQVGDEYRAGFEVGLVDQWIGLAAVSQDMDVETCPQHESHSCQSQADDI